jgi:hypothetical protein
MFGKFFGNFWFWFLRLIYSDADWANFVPSACRVFMKRRGQAPGRPAMRVTIADRVVFREGIAATHPPPPPPPPPPNPPPPPTFPGPFRCDWVNNTYRSLAKTIAESHPRLVPSAAISNGTPKPFKRFYLTRWRAVYLYLGRRQALGLRLGMAWLRKP